MPLHIHNDCSVREEQALSMDHLNPIALTTLSLLQLLLHCFQQ